MSLKDRAKGTEKAEEKNGTVIDAKQDAAAKPTEKEVARMVKPEVSAGQENVSYAVRVIRKLKDEFMKANEGLGLDYVYMGQWLVVNKKGQFVERDNPTTNYGDKIRVVIGAGEERYTLWGKQDTAEMGQLLIAEPTEAAARAKLDEIQNTLTAGKYHAEDIQSRYLATVIPEESINAEVPKLYLMSFSPTAKLAYGKWGLNLFSGAYAAMGFPRGTSVPSVLVEISTIEKTGNSTTYITLDFTAVKHLG